MTSCRSRGGTVNYYKIMRLSDIFFGLLLFGGGVVAGVFLCEAEVITGDQIKRTTKKAVDKVRGKDQVDRATAN